MPSSESRTDPCGDRGQIMQQPAVSLRNTNLPDKGFDPSCTSVDLVKSDFANHLRTVFPSHIESASPKEVESAKKEAYFRSFLIFSIS